MRRTAAPSRRPLVLRQDARIEVTPARFELFDSLRYVDLERLGRAANARIEVGTFQAGCCRPVVRARVRKGYVIALELERPKRKERTTPELKRVLAAVQRAYGGRPRPEPRLPVPLELFLKDPILTIDVMFCIQICAFGYCVTCCVDTEDPMQTFCAIFGVNPLRPS